MFSSHFCCSCFEAGQCLQSIRRLGWTGSCRCLDTADFLGRFFLVDRKVLSCHLLPVHKLSDRGGTWEAFSCFRRFDAQRFAHFQTFVILSRILWFWFSFEAMDSLVESIVELPFHILVVPNLKLKRPGWMTLPQPMAVFSFVLFSYFLVCGGRFCLFWLSLWFLHTF